MELSAGQKLTHYEILAPLGAGGMSTVYRALDTRLGREVALKVLPEAMAESDEWLLRFEREARTLASLNHPNVGAIHGVDQDGDSCFLILELVPGQDLEQRIQRGAISLDQTVDIALQIASALSAAHASGLIHRDLKPANVVISPEGRAKLLDFGLAKRVRWSTESSQGVGASGESIELSATRAGTLIGTVDYMSPEQSRGLEVDARTDVWSFGCVLFEMLTGSRIFPATTAPEKLAAIAADEPNWSLLPAGTPESLSELLALCLAKDARGRPANFEVLMRSLRELHSGGSELPAAPRARSVAVLPFVNAGGDPQDEYFSDGIADELIHALSQLSGLRVAPRTSAFAFKGKAVTVADIGSQLGVECVLEGSIRRGGDRVRVTAQLIDVVDGQRRWSDRFDREMGDLFDLQDEIAAAIASALRVELMGEGTERIVPQKTQSLDAYDALLRGKFLLEQRGSSISAALLAFEQAIALDPDMAAAHAGLSEAYGLLGYYGGDPPHRVMPKARAAAERALALDPHLAVAHTALGWVHSIYDWNTSAAMSEFQRAMALDPCAMQARYWYSSYVLIIDKGRCSEALALCREATKLDPLSLAARGALVTAQLFSGRYEEGLATVDQALELHPTAYLLWHHRAYAHFAMGSYEQAVRDYRHAVSLSSIHVWAKSGLGMTYARMGEHEKAIQVQDELVAEQGARYVSALCLAQVPANLGHLEEAMGLLEKAVEQRDGLLRSMLLFEPFRSLKREPRYLRLVERVGLKVPQ